MNAEQPYTDEAMKVLIAREMQASLASLPRCKTTTCQCKPYMFYICEPCQKSGRNGNA